MIETILIFLGICVVISLAFKLLGWLIIVPFKIGVWMLQGLVGLVLLVPVVIIACCFLGIVVPVLLAIVAIPVGLAAVFLDFIF